MKIQFSLKLARCCFIILLSISAVTALSWKFWNVWKPEPRHVPTLEELGVSENHLNTISHHAASDLAQPFVPLHASDYPWTRADGTPLPYKAWFKNPPLPKERSRLTRHGARVACWPSTGGVYIKQADPLDMTFLNLDRFRNTARQHNETGEDEFCTMLKMLGADFWNLPPRPEQKRSVASCTSLEQCFTPDTKNELLVAWPEDWPGVCVIPYDLAKQRGGELLHGYYNARTMSERCKVIMGLPGAQCDCRARCPHLQDLDWGVRDVPCERSDETVEREILARIRATEPQGYDDHFIW